MIRAGSEVAMRDFEIAQHFVYAANVVFYTMAKIIVTSGKFFIKHDRKALGAITAVITLSGFRNGTIAVSFDRGSAMALVRGMLGDDVEDMERDMLDAVGEVTNMISGHAREAMAKSGVVLQGATPTILVGDDTEIAYMSQAPVVVIPFSTPDGAFYVEFCLGE